MEIKVTSCADCPFYNVAVSKCSMTKEFVWTYKNRKTSPPSCPLEQSPITVKLESNEKG